MKQHFIAQKPEELSLVAEAILGHVPTEGALVVALRGDLGSGKTTLVQEIGRQLAVTVPITSPTFTIMKQYLVEHPTVDQLVHIDLYRIVSQAELAPLRFEQVVRQARSVVCVEWPERAADSIPPDALVVEIEIGKRGERSVTLTVPETE